jgi:hypothetical protein
MVLSRFITKSGFKALRDLYDVEGGRGQTWFSLGSNERILEFFNITDEIEEVCDSVNDDYNEALNEKFEGSEESSESFSITIEPIEAIDMPQQDVQLKYTDSRSTWQMPVASDKAHDLWLDDDYMPTESEFGGIDSEEDYYANNNQNPPLIYFIRDRAGDFHTRTIRSVDEDTIDSYPSLLQECWNQYIDASGSSNNTALVNFCNKEVTIL